MGNICQQFPPESFDFGKLHGRVIEGIVQLRNFLIAAAFKGDVVLPFSQLFSRFVDFGNGLRQIPGQKQRQRKGQQHHDYGNNSQLHPQGSHGRIHRGNIGIQKNDPLFPVGKGENPHQHQNVFLIRISRVEPPGRQELVRLFRYLFGIGTAVFPGQYIEPQQILVSQVMNATAGQRIG